MAVPSELPLPRRARSAGDDPDALILGDSSEGAPPLCLISRADLATPTAAGYACLSYPRGYSEAPEVEQIMALWLSRIGRHGEHEQQTVSTDRIYLSWNELTESLSSLPDKHALRKLLRERMPNAGEKKIINHSGQIWSFFKEMVPGDWVIIPSKTKAALHVAEIVGPYEFDASAKMPYRHSRRVKWIEKDIPRSNFDQDILNSLGAIMTICEIRRNDAEKRVREMAKLGWKSPAFPKVKFKGYADATDDVDEDSEDDSGIDLEATGRDMIAKLIGHKFRNHDLTRLVDAVLKAQGYVTYVSPPGPDKGVDILAAPEPLGFGQPRICVQVKSEDKPIDRPTLDQLIGTMQNFHADQGLLVSWGGFKSSVDREIPAQFFKVRMWDQKRLIDEILQHYDKLEDDLRAELPLKRIWTVAADDDDEDN